MNTRKVRVAIVGHVMSDERWVELAVDRVIVAAAAFTKELPYYQFIRDETREQTLRSTDGDAEPSEAAA